MKTGLAPAGLMANKPPTQPAPCNPPPAPTERGDWPERSSPQMNERLSALALLPSNSAIRFHPSYANFRYVAGVPEPPVLFHTFLPILRPCLSYSKSSRCCGPVAVFATRRTNRFSASHV